jgi:hypothetical protein
MRRLWLISALVASALLPAGPAWAGEIQLDPFIVGAGSIETVDDPLYLCGTDENHGGVTFDCGASQPLGNPLETATITLLATPSAVMSDDWEFLEWQDCPTPTMDELCEITAPDTTPVQASPTAVFVDTVLPALEPIIVSRPTFAGKKQVQFKFAADEAVHYECQMDGGEISGCPDGISYFEDDLGPGAHQLTVWAIDRSENKSDPVTASFAIAAPPVVKPPATKPPVVIPPVTLLIPRVLGPRELSARVSPKRLFSLGKLRVKCPAVPVRCRVTAVLRARLAKNREPVVVARKKLTLRPSTRSAVTLRLAKRAARVLEKRSRLKTAATVTISAPDVQTRKDLAVTLRMPKPKR